MQDKLKPCPTPWIRIKDLTGLKIATSLGADVLYNDSQCGDMQITDIDLDFIVKCVNSHQASVDALKAARLEMEFWIDGSTVELSTREALEKMEDALALAGGESE